MDRPTPDPAPRAGSHFRAGTARENAAEIAAELPAWRRQLSENEKQWRGAPTVADLARARDGFAGMTLALCAPGPSLADALPEIARLRGALCVTALDSAVAPLLDAGIAPDFVFVKRCDGAPAALLAGLPARDAMAFILPACAHPATLEACPGRRFFYMPADDHPDLAALARGSGLPAILLKPSAAVMALLLSAALRFDTVALCGFDFAYSGGMRYCPGTRYLAMPELMARLADPADPAQRPRETSDIFHEPTATSLALHGQAEELFRIVNAERGFRNVVNASRGVLFNLNWLPPALALGGVTPEGSALRSADLRSGDEELDRANAATGNYLNPLIVRNALANRAKMDRYRMISELFAARDRFAGRTVVVAGAGGSLDDLLPALARHRARFLLGAVDAAVAPLLDAGLRPDLALSIDPMRQVAGFLAGLPTEGIPLVASVATHPEALSAWRGPVLLGWCPIPSAHIMQVYTLFPDLPAFLPHANCGSTLALLLRDLGAAEVILAGVDFAFTRDRWYARGVRHPYAERTGRAALLAALGERARETTDARGDAVLTDPTFELYARTLERFLEREGFARVFNAGAGICTRIPRVDLDERFAA